MERGEVGEEEYFNSRLSILLRIAKQNLSISISKMALYSRLTTFKECKCNVMGGWVVVVAIEQRESLKVNHAWI